MVRIAESHGLHVHFYADDSQMYTGFSPLITESSAYMSTIKNCLSDVKVWKHANFLKINMDKTNVMFFAHSQELNLFTVNVIIENEYFE